MLRAILVDDEPIILDELRELLENNGCFQVAGAYSSPLEALAADPGLRPDCAFLDIEMPEMSGIELAERLSDKYAGLEIIFVSAYNHYATQAFEVSALDYLLKPIRPEQIDRVTKKLLRGCGPVGSPCSIRCFGAFEVLAGGRPVKWSRSKSKELVAYLLQNEGKWVSKYKLCELHWPDSPPEQALSYLQTSVYTARKNLREAGCGQLKIRYSDDRYILTAENTDWDIRRFDEQYEAFSRTGSGRTAENALGFYQGEYLEGEDWPWADLHRESYICKCDELCQKAGGLVLCGKRDD